MRIYLHIGMGQGAADGLQRVLADKREQLLGKGILFPRSPGNKNHTRLFMAVTNPDHIDQLRYNRGFGTAASQQKLYDTLAEDLAREVAQQQPDTLILSASQLGTSLHRLAELERLKSLLAPLSDDIRIVAHIEQQARAMTRAYAGQIIEGRAVPLSRDLALTGGNWWQSCLQEMPDIDAQAGVFEEIQAPPFWLDYTELVAHWEQVFGKGSVNLRTYDPDLFASNRLMDEVRATFGIEYTLGKIGKVNAGAQPSAAWLVRGQQLNTLILQLLKRRKHILPRQLWRSFLSEISIGGPPIAAGSLSMISSHFAADNAALTECYPALGNWANVDPPLEDWVEPDPELGFRASQYLLSFMYRIEKATKSAEPIELHNTKPDNTTASQIDGLSPLAQKLMPPKAIQNFQTLKSSPFAPHNRMGAVNEEDLGAPYSPVATRTLRDGSSGNVIVGCMKNEAPYIVEWIAYHRAIGIDNFVIYTNDCSDGTDEILGRLQDMGVLQHRSNDGWKGNSPQQYALNQSLKEPVIRNADWIIHIDVDEFINVRTGNGTLQDFFDVVPDATNIAMTWRMFGHNDVTQLADTFVVDQFDTCAPKYCPKPHTAWGFKTMFKNTGAYAKISCHRPTKLDDAQRDKVRWVNGSGQDMTHEAINNGWRNSRKSIGYDLLQLNHYALRSAESFMIKRQRGRALHVDRSIGLNYWIRMDWSDFRDVTIKRNLPRLRAEYDRLMIDDILRKWHQSGFDWHRAKAAELHGMPEFSDLYKKALTIKLNEVERAAYALALDMDS